MEKVIKGRSLGEEEIKELLALTPSEINGKLLEDYFPNTSIDDLEKLVQRHKDIDSWFNSTSISEKDFNHIQEIMISAGELKSKVDYKILVK